MDNENTVNSICYIFIFQVILLLLIICIHGTYAYKYFSLGLSLFRVDCIVLHFVLLQLN